MRNGPLVRPHPLSPLEICKCGTIATGYANVFITMNFQSMWLIIAEIDALHEGHLVPVKTIYAHFQSITDRFSPDGRSSVKPACFTFARMGCALVCWGPAVTQGQSAKTGGEARGVTRLTKHHRPLESGRWWRWMSSRRRGKAIRRLRRPVAGHAPLSQTVPSAIVTARVPYDTSWLVWVSIIGDVGSKRTLSLLRQYDDPFSYTDQRKNSSFRTNVPFFRKAELMGRPLVSQRPLRHL
jgi:hypothetical protein